MSKFPIACVLMAAGNSSRFGSNKLTADFGDRLLIEAVLDAYPAENFVRAVLVTRYQDVRDAALDRDMGVVWLDSPAPVSETVRRGLYAVRDYDAAGALFAVCDQPWLSAASVARLCSAFAASPGRIYALGCGSTRGNPVIFPRSLWSELETLPSGKSGGSVIESHSELLNIVQADSERELRDVDTPDDLS